MGAGQSSQTHDDAGGHDTASEKRTCYYELLGVDRRATEEEIKKAYHRKALELHPDRNYGNVEATTSQFAEVQAAYEILSDPQERAWYDSHRDAILQNRDDGSTQYHDGSVKFTTTADIVSVFTRYHGQLDYSDSKKGFFSTVREMFDNLAAEENEVCKWDSIECPYFPSFGTAKDTYAAVAKPFYNTWDKFATVKSFSWEDRFRTTDAPDRRVRRMMEKENRRFREEAIREFNEAVRSLVAFVKKRDPRYVPTTQSEADRQKALRDAAAAQAARSRAANQAKLGEHRQPEWTKTDSAVENVFEESSEGDQEEFECITCSKIFKSEKQWQAHERSKKHLKAAQRLRKEMEIESKALGLEEEESQDAVEHSVNIDLTTTANPQESEVIADKTSSLNLQTHDEGKSHDDVREHGDDRVNSLPKAPKDSSDVESLPSDANNVLTPRETASRTSSQNVDRGSPYREPDTSITKMTQNLTRSASLSDYETNSKSFPKVGKAKEKRARKAMRENQDKIYGEKSRCNSCQAEFSSRTQLFSHIKDFNHAQPVSRTDQGKRHRGKEK